MGQSTQKKAGAEDCYARVSNILQQMLEKKMGKPGSKTKCDEVTDINGQQIG